MKTLFVVTLLGFSLLLQDLPASQEQKREPQTISTESKEVVAELWISGRKLEEVRGEAAFTPAAGNTDDTLTGTLVFKISEVERQRVASVIKKPLDDIPAIVEKSEVSAFFERGTQCPDLRFEIFAQNRHRHVDVSQTEIGLGVGSLRFSPTVVSFKESERELSKMLCIWAKRLWGGRGTKGMPPAFTKALKGEDPNN